MFRFLKNSAPFYFLWVSFIVFVFILKYYFSPYEIFLSINHFGHKNLDTFFTYYTYLGTPTAMIPIMIGAYLFTNQYHKKGFLIVSIISSLVLVLAIFFAKELYAYPRPYSHPFLKNKIMFPEKAEILFNNSFPSGHTAAAFLMFCLFSLFSNKKNIFLDIMFFILALMVGWSRIYLGAHFFEDVASGSIFGVIIATVVYLSYKNIVTKR